MRICFVALLVIAAMIVGYIPAQNAPSGAVNWISQVRNKPLGDVREYNFAAQSPATNLFAGSCSFLMAYIPPGVVVGDTLRISGGTGTAEVFTVGSISGKTIGGTCANNHSGNYTVTSATAGGQETANAGHSLYFPEGTYQLYAPIAIAGDGTIECASNESVLVANTATQNVIVSTTSTTSQRFRISGCAITAGTTKTAGDAIQLNGSGSAINYAPVIDSVRIDSQYNGIHGASAQYVSVSNTRISQTPSGGVGILFENTINTDAGDHSVLNTIIGNSDYNGTAVKLVSGGGLKLSNSKFQNMSKGLVVAIADGVSTSQVLVSNCSFDQNHDGAITLASPGSGSIFDLNFSNNQISGNGNATTAACMTVGNGIANVSIVGNKFSNCTAGVSVGGTSGTTNIAENIFGGELTHAVSTAGSATGIVIRNNYASLVGTVVVLGVPAIYVDTRPNLWMYADLSVALANASDGSEVYCQDCNSTCSAGSSTGQICAKVNGSWLH